MRSIVPFNNGWLFAPKELHFDTADSAFEPVTLPHTNIILPHHNFDNAEYQFISTYRKRFHLPEPRNERRVFIDFEGAMIACSVWLNGNKLGDHGGGYTPFSFDITDYLRDGENMLTVRLDSTERTDIPPYGFVVDYLTFGGIYREVSLRYVEPCYIADVFVKASKTLTDNPTLEVDITLQNEHNRISQGEIVLLLDGQRLASNWVRVEPGKHTIQLHSEPLTNIERWTLENPKHYSIEIQFTNEELIDRQTVNFGFREARFEKDGFYLNGEKLKLIGLNRHQTYPYIGAAAPARLQRKDADIIKYELGCNIVRTSHYPQSRHFIDRCDEIGLLVFEEIPGWQFVGDEDWQALTLRDVEAMIVRDRNHPSIVLWGVRVNESGDNDALYARTNALAHQLDPTRQTGGVRYFQHSNFLEDVFTFNDFSNSVQEPLHLPHMITEFNGHMFPTKSFDQEERLIEHAQRHAKIQNLQMGHPNIAGAIGWCAFDYNTHREFGSGDRICYHGVMDIFRLPKFAAYFYETQQPPIVRPIVRAATYWTMGDRSGSGNDPLTVFSNCDEIEVFFGTESLGRFQPDRETYPHLPYPPFTVKGLSGHALWGKPLGDLRVVGLVNGEIVAEQQLSPKGVPHALTLEADDSQLNADGADMTRLVFKIVDEYGNRLPYVNQPIYFEIDGPGELIGENPFALIGGQAALYLKARHESGTVTIRASTPRLESASVIVAIK